MEEPIHLDNQPQGTGDKYLLAAGELEFIQTPFHFSLMRDCIVSTMPATMYNVMITNFGVKLVHAQADSMMFTLYLVVTIPKPGFKFGDQPI